jgi:hypothetical protein
MLTEKERALLQFEADHSRNTGAKADLIAHTFGMTRISYYQTINALLDRAEALEAMPVEVGRMRRLRDRRVALRKRRGYRSDAV